MPCFFKCVVCVGLASLGLILLCLFGRLVCVLVFLFQFLARERLAGLVWAWDSWKFDHVGFPLFLQVREIPFGRRRQRPIYYGCCTLVSSFASSDVVL